MNWRNVQALHIFAPDAQPYDANNWVEQIMGTTIKPIFERFGDSISWIWITRYIQPNRPFDYDVPGEYLVRRQLYRFIVFRASVTENERDGVQQETIRLARANNLFTDPRGWVDYDVVADLGSDRFVRSNANEEERIRRARLVANYMDVTNRLMLDALTQDLQGKWQLEENRSPENPKGSFFESVHHVFCNATGVPTTAMLAIARNQIKVRTNWASVLTTDAWVGGSESLGGTCRIALLHIGDLLWQRLIM